MSESHTPPSDDDLQFDTAIPDEPNAEGNEGRAEGVTCALCRRSLRDRYFTTGTDPVCANCRETIARQAAPVTEWPLLVRALLFGLGAAVLGAIIYYAVIAITGWEIGLVAILCGYMVGWAVRRGAAGRGGRRLQVAAVALTYVSVALAYLPLAIRGASVGRESAAPVAADSFGDVTGRATSETAPDIGRVDTAAAAGSRSGLGALGGLIYLTLALPVLVIMGSMPSGLISALIIGFGLQQAWSMTAAPELTIHGPFAVGRGPGPTPPSPAPS
jgi:hypothetical protein